MYARNVDGRRLTFAVSGMLWQRSLVMVDRETGTLWSHLLGRAMRGALAGRELERLPSMMTDWRTWRALHPETTVVALKRTSRNYRRAFYRDPKQFVVGLDSGGNARAWGFDALMATPVINDTFQGTPVAVVFDRPSVTAMVFERQFGGRTLELTLDHGQLTDRSGTYRWSPLTGKLVLPDQANQTGGGDSVAGPPRTAAGGRSSDLRPLPAIVSFRRAWQVLHGESSYYDGKP